MLDLGLSKFDKLIVGGATVGALLAGYVLANESIIRQLLGIRSSGQSHIGYVITAKNDTRRRLGLSPVWYSVENNESLYERDSLFTGQESELEIEIENQGTVSLGPNSLIRLERFNDEISIDLQLGSATANLSRGQRINLIQSGQKTTLEAQDQTMVAISRTAEGEIDLTNLGGKSTLEIESQTTDIGQDEKVRVEKDLQVTRERADIALTTPKPKSIVWISENEKVDLKWFDADANTKEYLVNIATDKSFKTIVERASSLEQSIKVASLKQGSEYYWQVLSRDQRRKSLIAQFMVLPKSGPKIIHPFEGQKIEVPKGENTELVRFHWRHQLTAKNYQVQISEKSDFSQVLLDSQTNQNAINKVSLEGGKYYWRVRSTDIDALRDVWSEIVSFSVGDGAKVAAIDPSLLSPKDIPSAFDTGPLSLANQNNLGTSPADPSKPSLRVAELSHRLAFDEKILARKPANIEKAIANPVQLAWAGPKNQNYKVQISPRRDFSRITFEKSTKGTKLSWPGKPGDYYWRVIADSGYTEEVSSVGKIAVKLPPPENLEIPKNRFQVNSPELLEKPGPKLLATWKPVPMAKNYTAVVLTTDEKPKVVAKTIVDKPQAEFALAKSGQYKLRVAASLPDGKKQSIYSKPKELDFKKELKLTTPKVQMPADGVTIVSFSKKSTEPLVFGWDKVQHAQKYEVQYSATEDFKTLLLTKNAPETQVVLTNETPRGIVFWRVRAVRGVYKSPWSKPRFFELSSQ